ncbi:MAG: 2-oxoglutarate and iron-dependent oxygenase domain-containing protein [Pseudomonadota bacterium]
MTPAQPTAGSADGIPVIDLAPLIDGSDPKAVASALHRASRDVGFIYAANHGIPEDLIARARSAAMKFFRKPDAEKQVVAMAGTHRGFLATGGARMRDDVAADLKESFVWGYEDEDGGLPDDHSIRGVNRWPDDPVDLKTAAKAYFEAGDRVARHLMRGFARGLDLDPDFFLKTASNPLSRASFVYYPPQEVSDGAQERYGVGPHTDFGVLTVLCQDSVGGLEVQNARGEWMAAPPIDGTLVINVGDLLARWTDDTYRSTPHRVVNRSGRERLSIVLCYDPDPSTMIDSRDVFGPDHVAAADPITCGNYLSWRFDKAFRYRAETAA